MTHKDYIYLAKLLNLNFDTKKRYSKKQIVFIIAMALRDSNPNYKPDLFADAAYNA